MPANNFKPYKTATMKYNEQPFAEVYKPEDIVKTKDGLKTKDGKYKTFTHRDFSYWEGENCYYNTAYGYFFICGNDLLQKAADNLNQCLDKNYEFNPYQFKKKTANNFKPYKTVRQ